MMIRKFFLRGNCGLRVKKIKISPSCFVCRLLCSTKYIKCSHSEEHFKFSLLKIAFRLHSRYMYCWTCYCKCTVMIVLLVLFWCGEKFHSELHKRDYIKPQTQLNDWKGFCFCFFYEIPQILPQKSWCYFFFVEHLCVLSSLSLSVFTYSCWAQRKETYRSLVCRVNTDSGQFRASNLPDLHLEAVGRRYNTQTC